MHPQSPASLRTDVQPTHMEPIRELRLAISILFHFLRRSTIDKVKQISLLEFFLEIMFFNLCIFESFIIEYKFSNKRFSNFPHRNYN